MSQGYSGNNNVRLIPTFWASERRLTPVDSPSTAYCLPLTIHQLPNTIYQLPTSPHNYCLLYNELGGESRTKSRADKWLDGGVDFAASWLFQSNIQPTAGPDHLARPRSNPKKVWPLTRYLIKRLENEVVCGYTSIMPDRWRKTDRMLLVRFTEAERRRLKANTALEGLSMQQYIRALVLKDLEKQERKRKT